MTKSIPASLTIEEAVALMIGLDYLPSGLTVLDMTAAFLEESEVDLESNIRSESFILRHDVCQARHQLATSLLAVLTQEASNSDSEFLIQSDEASPVQRFTTTSLNNWVQDRFGISLWAPSRVDEQSVALTGISWQDITLKIYTSYQIGYRIKDGPYKSSSFHKIGLMGQRKQALSARGLILIGLSEGKKFPAGSRPSAAEKSSISVIRNALKTLAPFLDDDPFYAYNSGDGWKPKFKLVDDRRNADERAKKEAVHISLDPETRDFDVENDAAEQWLKEHGNQ